MPDAAKKKPAEQTDADEKEVRRDAFGNEIEAGAPPLAAAVEPDEDEAEAEPDVVVPKAKKPPKPKTEDEPSPKQEKPEEKLTTAPEPKKKEVPPDLVPEDKADDKPDENSGDAESEPAKEKEPEATDSPDPAEDAEDETTPFDDEKTDRAISDIVAKESDDVLAAQDAAAAKGKVDIPRGKDNSVRKKWVRRIVLLVVFGGLVAAAVVPASRYWALNTAGVRSSSSVTVVDSTTQLPLKGVDVSLAGATVRTDSEGQAVFDKLKLGPAELTVSRVGFERLEQRVTIGWGSNPLGQFALKATGVQYVIEVKDYLTGQPLEGVEATNGAATAISDKDGKITLTLENTVVAQGGVALGKEGYRSEAISLNEDPAEPTKAVMVISRKAVFVARDDSKYNLYKSDIDGKNREVLLAGTGDENSNISLVVSQDGTQAAYVSTRSGKRDDGGFLLSSLMLVDVEKGNTLTIAEAAQVQLIDWVGTRLVFQLGTSDSGADDRYTIVSYDYGSSTRLQLVAASRLQAVVGARGSVYYASDDEPGLFKIGVDGKGQQQVFDGEVASVLRSTYGTLSLQDADGTWVSYDLASGSKTQTGTPSSLASRLYIDDSEQKQSLWASQGVLRVYDVAAAKDTEVATVSGLTYPLQWAGTTAVIFRVSNATETADYIVSTGGGTPHKIADVTPAYGFSQAQ